MHIIIPGYVTLPMQYRRKIYSVRNSANARVRNFYAYENFCDYSNWSHPQRGLINHSSSVTEGVNTNPCCVTTFLLSTSCSVLLWRNLEECVVLTVSKHVVCVCDAQSNLYQKGQWVFLFLSTRKKREEMILLQTLDGKKVLGLRGEEMGQSYERWQ